MIFGNKILKALEAKKHKAYFGRSTALNLYTKKIVLKDKYIHIATNASVSEIRQLCKDMKLSCKIHQKINKTTTELLIKDKYIIYPFLKIKTTNSYASRKYSKNYIDSMNAQDFTLNSLLVSSFDSKGESDLLTLSKEVTNDINKKIIRFVGSPNNKIAENRLHMLEAGKLLSLLGKDWTVEFETYQAILKRSLEIAIVSNDSIKSTFSEIIENSIKPSLAFRFFKDTKLLEEVMPELLRGVGLAQSNKANNLDLFNHIMYALDSVKIGKSRYTALRWACVFHDIAKPYTVSYDKKGNIHFYGHDKIGAIFASRWLTKYNYDQKLIQDVATICRHHLFDASLTLDDDAIKRLIKRIGKNYILTLLDMREADRWGTGRKDISMKKIDILRSKIKRLM